MLPALTSLIAAAVLALNLYLPDSDTAVRLLKSGQALRFHVIAHDDTDRMQRIKLSVRDAVQDCYARQTSGGSMIERAEALLPALTEAAERTAAAEGLPGSVSVTLGTAWFDTRTLGTTTFPEGEYPALIIHLGDAKGRNWWGLLDPELSARWAAIPADAEQSGEIRWDWSWQGLLAALRSCFTGGKGGA